MEHTEENLSLKRITYSIDNENLEGLILLPKSLNYTAGVVYVHGHLSSAWRSLATGYALLQAGWAVFLPSLRGYGFSEGSRDYDGRATIKGLVKGIEIFTQEPYVNKEKIAIWGVSRGATAAALAAIQYPNMFKTAIFQSGAYDMKKYYETTPIDGIKEAIREEAGTDEKSFRERSPLFNIDKIQCPAFILHGEKDERIPVEQAQLLDEQMTKLNKAHDTFIVPEAGHALSSFTTKEHVLPWLKKHLT